jgi:hypothetical protein
MGQADTCRFFFVWYAHHGMVTRMNIELYLHYGGKKQVNNKAVLAHLAAKKSTALKAGTSCYWLQHS